MFAYQFMVNAFIAACIVAVVAGVAGFFLVLRQQTFASHALSHVGFSGAIAAGLVGVPPLWGFAALTSVAGLAMGYWGEALNKRDIAIGIVLALSLGFGLLFLHFYTGNAAQAQSVLFGNVLGVDTQTLRTLFALGSLCLGALAVISRPLLFATLQPELAEAKQVSLRKIAMLFMGIAALAISACAQIVGALLVFTLMVGPAASAQQLTPRLGRGIALSVFFALIQACLGLVLAYYTDYPPSFWITVLSALVYALIVSLKARF